MRKLALIACILSVGTTAFAGPTAHVGREFTKGATEEVKKEVADTKIDVAKGAKDVSSGIISGVSGHGREIDDGARNLGRAMAQGFFLELRSEMGADGKGPLARSLSDAGELGSRQLIRGIGEEVGKWLPACQGDDRGACIDAMVQRFAYASSHAAAKGAADAASPWGSLIFGGLGFLGGLVVAAIIALLFGQRRVRAEVRTLRPQTA